MLTRRPIDASRNAIEGAQRCVELTSRLLTFSRRSPLQPSVLDFTVFMPGLIKLLNRTLGERVSLSLTMDEALPTICVDHAQLEAALINLAVNARDAMPGGRQLDHIGPAPGRRRKPG